MKQFSDEYTTNLALKILDDTIPSLIAYFEYSLSVRTQIGLPVRLPFFRTNSWLPSFVSRSIHVLHKISSDRVALI